MRSVTLPERLTTKDRIHLLAAFASTSAKSAEAWLAGATLKPNTHDRLKAAAEVLGFEPAKSEGRAA